MTSIDSQHFDSYIPVYDVMPEKWEEARPVLVERLKMITNAVNLREIGWFLDEESIAGKQFIPGVNEMNDGGGSQQFRTVIRKVIDFGALPDNTNKSVAHGITITNNFTLTQFYAAATDPTTPQMLVIPYVSVAGLVVQLDMGSTFVTITTNSAFARFSRCYVTIEFMQEL